MSWKPFSAGLTDPQPKDIFLPHDDHQIHHGYLDQIQPFQKVRKRMPLLLGSAARKCPNFHEDQYNDSATGQ